MIQLSVCPSTLAEGFDTYSPSAQKMLFDGAKVSHILHVPSPASDTKEAKEAVENAGRISLFGVQPKFSIVVGYRFSYALYWRKVNRRNLYLEATSKQLPASEPGLLRGKRTSYHADSLRF